MAVIREERENQKKQQQNTPQHADSSLR